MLRKLLNKVEARLLPYAVPHVTEALVAVQTLLYVMVLANPNGEAILERMALTREGLMQGEAWRVLTFAVMPPAAHPLWAAFGLYLFYIMGTALDREWGTLRYNLYLLVGWAAAIGAVFLAPGEPMTNVFIGASVFLAFAWLYPDFELLIMFLLPVKVKWLALVTWLLIAGAVVTGDWPMQAAAVAGVVNWFLFFGGEIYGRIRMAGRRMVKQSELAAMRDDAFHRCTVCGVTEKSDPEVEFRYCDACDGAPCYCMEHIARHEHIRRDEKAAARR